MFVLKPTGFDLRPKFDNVHKVYKVYVYKVYMLITAIPVGFFENKLFTDPLLLLILVQEVKIFKKIYQYGRN